MSPSHRRLRVLVLGASLAALAVLGPACSGGGGGGAPASASLNGSLAILPATSTVLEQEPNDTPAQANPVGQLLAGANLTILGSIRDDGSDDFDAFLVDVPEPIEVTASLAHDAGFDFDFWVYDPLTQSVTFSFATVDVPEVGTFPASGTFILIVSSFQGSGSYTLGLSAVAALHLGATADGAHLGALEAGRTRVLRGEGTRRVSLSLPTGAELRVRGAGVEVAFADATPDPRAARPVASLPVLAANEARARFAPRSRAELSLTGQGAWSVEVEARALGETDLAPAAPTPLALESLHHRRAPRRPFGEPWPAVVGELLVRPLPHGPWKARLAALGGVELDATAGFAHLVRVPVPTGLEEVEALRSTVAAGFALRAGGELRDVAPNHWHQAQQTTPNDPFFNLQWHYTQIQLPAAWGITTGSNDVIVAVLDTGSSNHPDLAGRFIAGYDFISSAANAGDGGGIDPDPTDVGDGNGLQPSSFHGTHVAGTIGALTNNGSGVAGVTWSTRIMPLRVLGLQGGTDFDIGNAVRFAARLANNSNTLPPERAHILNLSLGGPGSSQAMQDTYTAARNQGVTIFAAAGNNNNSIPFFPSAYAGVISVSAVDFLGNKAPYSNFHSTVDIAAPGGSVAVDQNGDGYADGVLSTKINDAVAPAQAVFAFEQGTSMAAPHAAGVAALMLAVDPSLTPTQVQTILQDTASDLGAPGKDPIFGHGLINAHAAVLAASGGGGGPPQLALSAESLQFSAAQTQLDVQVQNVGGGTLTLSAPTVDAPPSGTWLSATLGPSSTGNINASSVRVSVDRGGLPPAIYFGAVNLGSDGGSATIQVLMTVGADDGLPDVEIFVLAVDSTTFETLGQFVINPSSTSLGYVFAALPPGSYFLAAGSDDDDNGFICDVGDVWCGLYPTLNQPRPVVVPAGASLQGFDFPVVSGFNSSLGTGPSPFGALGPLRLTR